MKKVPYIIIACLVAMLFLQRECHHCPEADCPPQKFTPGTKSIVLTKPAEISLHEVKREPKHKLKPVAIIPGDTPALADQPAMATRCAQKLFYIDTIFEENNFRAIIQDSLFNNEIVYRKPYFQNLRPQTVETQYVKEDPRRKLFIGAGMGGKSSWPGDSTGSFIDIGPSILYISKKDHAYSYTYLAFHRLHLINTYWKINLKK